MDENDFVFLIKLFDRWLSPKDDRDRVSRDGESQALDRGMRYIEETQENSKRKSLPF